VKKWTLFDILFAEELRHHIVCTTLSVFSRAPRLRTARLAGAWNKLVSRHSENQPN